MRIERRSVLKIVLLCAIFMCIGAFGAYEVVNSYYQNKMVTLENKYKNELNKVKAEYGVKEAKLKTFEFLYKDSQKELDERKKKITMLQYEFDTYKKQVAISKKTLQVTRGNMPAEDLKVFAAVDVKELNEWIKGKAPSNSPFIGNAQVFIDASNATGLNPKYLVAHAGLESAWGTSTIARNKNNYFGIGSYNDSPYNSSYTFAGSFYDGIMKGAKWIQDNFTDKGQNTLLSMIYGKKTYCVDDNGNPSQEWINHIVNMVTG